MTAASWLTLIVIAGFIWGGFLILVTLALRRERTKVEDEDEPRPLWVP